MPGWHLSTARMAVPFGSIEQRVGCALYSALMSVILKQTVVRTCVPAALGASTAVARAAAIATWAAPALASPARSLASWVVAASRALRSAQAATNAIGLPALLGLKRSKQPGNAALLGLDARH